MIEAIMFIGIGFLAASLLGLVSIPLVHARAVRLTMRRIQAGLPLSMAEFQADKDHLRAEFAMSTCRLEVAMSELRTGRRFRKRPPHDWPLRFCGLPGRRPAANPAAEASVGLFVRCGNDAAAPLAALKSRPSAF
jgi:hypothetical protein